MQKFILITLLCLILAPSAVCAAEETKLAQINASEILKVNIPGVKLTEPIVTETETREENGQQIKYVTKKSTPWIAQYIVGLYSYAIVIISLIAVISLMFGGLLYLSSAGRPEQVNKAKSIIFGAISGLVVLLSANLMLRIINPDLSNLSAIEIDIVEKIEIELVGDISSTPISGPPNCQTISTPPTDISDFTTQQKSSHILEIINKLKDRVSYIIGSRDGVGCDKAAGKYQICLDCSGLVTYAYQCGLGIDIQHGTNYLFSRNTIELSPEKPDNLDIGDVIGWKKDTSSEHSMVRKCGHVGIYIGNNQVAHVHGPPVLTNENVANRSLSIMKYEIWMSKYPWSVGRKLLTE